MMARKLLPPDDGQVARCGEKLDADLGNPLAPHLLSTFYSPDGGYAGHTFASLKPIERDDITHSDLLAITTLEVKFEPLALRRLLAAGPDRSTMLGKLAAVESDLHIAHASNLQLDNAYEFWLAVHNLVGNTQEVAVHKLCARKRPLLIPIVDRVIKTWLAPEAGGRWKTIRALLTDERRKKLRNLAAQADQLAANGVGELPELRLFDTLIWMLWSESAAPTRDALTT